MSVQVYAGGVLAYDDRLPAEKNYTLLSGLVSESLNKGGTATIVLPPGHPASDSFPALVVPVEIYKNGRLRWRGRPLPNFSDIYGRRTVTCEGELCFLNDVVSRPYSYSGDPAELFTAVLEAYNAGADAWKRFVIGTISVTGDAMDLSSVDPEKTLVTVQKLIKTYGGYILFDSAPDGARRINWYSQLPYSCNQKIQYGHNLTDFNSQADLTGFATRIVPYGATDADGNRIKIDNDGKDYVENAEAVAARGVIEKPVIYDDISDPDELKARAEQDVQSSGTLPAVLRLSAVDMSRLNLQLDGFRIGQRVEAESGPHGMSGLYDLVSLTEDIVNPTVGQATLTRDAAYIDLASGTMTGALNKQLQAEKDEYKKAFSSYLGAVASLTSTILGAKGGAVRILDTDGDGLNDTLYVADNPDPELAEKVWRFNYEGWAGSKTGYNGPFIMGATLKDGLLAAAVTAAHLVAGTIASADGKTFFLDLDKGILRMNATEFSVSGKTVDKIAQEKADVAEDNAVGQAIDIAQSAVNAQTQADIFNKLTNNGALQGLFMQNGQLYINASYITALEKLFAKDITMTGKFECTAQAYLPPTYDDIMNILWSISYPDQYPPKDSYDLDGDGSFTNNDFVLAKNVYLGNQKLSSCAGASKSTATVTIDMSNPDKAIRISGTNAFGSVVECYVGINPYDCSFASRDYLDRMIAHDPGTKGTDVVGSKVTVNGAIIGSTESWEATLSNAGSHTHTCARTPVAVIVGAQYQGTGLVTGIWTPATSGLENSMYGATGGYTDVWPTTVTIDGKNVTVKRGGSASLKYFVTAIMQMD